MKKIWLLLAGLLCCLFTISGCKKSLPPQAKAPSADQLKQLQQAKTGYFDVLAPSAKAYLKANPKVIVLDVRTAREFQSGHLPNAINMDVMQSSFSNKLKTLPKGKTVVLYCRSGNRSKTAMRIMKQMKFSKVLHLQYGILDWKRYMYPTPTR